MTAAAATLGLYRRFELPWTPIAEEQRRLRKIATAVLGATLVLAILLPVLPVPERPHDVVEDMPERFARLVLEKKTPPPPPPVEPVQPEEIIEQPAVKELEPAPRDIVRERPVETPKLDPRRKAAQAGLLPFQDQLAALRDNAAISKAAHTRNLAGAVGETTRADRSLITSRVGSGSGGINTASLSRGYGAGTGALTGHATTQVEPSFGGGTGGSAVDSTTRASGTPSRSREEIELVFDRNKSAIYALYSRALRSNPQLKGKLVLELTIAPSGEVTACRVASSELDDPELERKLVARVKMFRFEDKDVETVTTTKPIDFFPA